MKRFDRLHVNPVTLTSKDKEEIPCVGTIITRGLNVRCFGRKQSRAVLSGRIRAGLVYRCTAAGESWSDPAGTWWGNTRWNSPCSHRCLSETCMALGYVYQSLWNYTGWNGALSLYWPMLIIEAQTMVIYTSPSGKVTNRRQNYQRTYWNGRKEETRTIVTLWQW